jgi:SpoVK/Ycf46/Vps4 family AAA+-type ATPase
VPNPDAAARAAFLAAMLARPEVDSRLGPGEVDAIAAATEGFSGSDMACLCRHAAMAPVRELLAAARAGARKRRRAGSGRGGGNGGSGGGAAAAARSGGGGGGGGRGAASGGGLGPVRKLVAADFEAALRKIRPAALDAGG